MSFWLFSVLVPLLCGVCVVLFASVQDDNMWSSLKNLYKLKVGQNAFHGKRVWTFDKMGSFHQFSAQNIDGDNVSMAQFKDKVLLITNVACKCGFTKDSYTQMEQLSLKYSEYGFQVLCFPSNQVHFTVHCVDTIYVLMMHTVYQLLIYSF